MSQSIESIAEKRYAAKAYDPSKRLTSAQVDELRGLLRLAPSSINIQPWHFIMASSDEGKARIAKAAHSQFAYNKPSIESASQVIVFAAKTNVDDNYVHEIITQEDKDGRFVAPANKEIREKTMLFYTALHRDTLKDAPIWLGNQVYINLGMFLMGVAAMGLDATPMEGIDKEILNAEFDLPAKGYTAQFIATVGYHAEDDYNAKLPKSRLPLSKILTEI